MNRIVTVKLIKKISNPFQGGSAQFEMFNFTGNGSRTSFGISFTCHKSLGGSCLDNNAEITIYNVKPDTYNEIYSYYSQYRVELYVGYEGKELSRLMSGYLLRVWNTREGMDDKMILSVYQYADRAIAEGNEALSSQNIEIMWTGDRLWAMATSSEIGAQELIPRKNLQELIYELANKFKSLSNDNSQLKVEKDNIKVTAPPPKGKSRTFSGTFHGIMDTLGHEFGFTWSIQDDVLVVYPDADVSGGTGQSPVLSIGPSTLMSCEPMLQGQFSMNQIGMKITAVLDPVVVPGKVVELESKIYPKFNGKYFVHEADFSGSTIASEWKMDLESKTRRL